MALTIAELAGMPPAPDWQGRSLLDPAHPPRAYFYVAQDEFKLGSAKTSGSTSTICAPGTDEMYDVLRDPDEQAA